MSLADLLGLTFEALRAHRMRYGLSALAIAVGVAAVVLLSSIGEGTRRFIMGQFTQFGTTLVAVVPGRVETQGPPSIQGNSARKLTLDDARALRRLSDVDALTPVTYGSTVVEYGNRSRRVYVYGTTSHGERVWSTRVEVGQFIPEMDWDRTAAVVALGPRLKRELFEDANALGEIVRIGQSRFRVIGIMESKGQVLGFDIDDSAYIPVANAIALFNRPELDEIDILAASTDAIDPVADAAKALLKARHDGKEDFTVVTQKDMQGTINRILGIVSAVVTGIAGISLLVGAIGILTIMWIVVQERVTEIGLVKALGARRGQILGWYLFEAAVTALVGGLAGLAAGLGGAWALGRFLPGLEAYTPPGVVVAALLMALLVGLGAGVAPALRAARLDPVEALRGE